MNEHKVALQKLHIDEHKVANNLVGSNTFVPGEKRYNGVVEQPHAQWIISNPKTKPVHGIT